MPYKYKAGMSEYFEHFGNKIQNFVGGNNQFEKYLQQKLEKHFIDIKILPIFTKPSVTVTLYKKSTKVHLIPLHFIFINVQIDGSNKYQHQDFTEIYKT